MPYSKDGKYIQEIPFYITLANGIVRSDPESFTEDEILSAGYIFVDEAPEIDINIQKCYWKDGILTDNFWSAGEWIVENLSELELDLLLEELKNQCRLDRDEDISLVSWRVERYLSEVRLGLTPIDDIGKLDIYIQKLRDIPDQEGFPENIDWPSLE